MPSPTLPVRHLFLLIPLVLAGCGGGGGGGSTGFTVSGTIQAAAGNAVDSDVNDPFAPYASNDSIAAAQSIPNPVVVGGYLNQPGTGPAGRSHASGDTSDYYRISLTANQLVVLNIANHFTGDLDLFLYEPGTANPIASSDGVGPTESLSVATAGTYILRVEAYAGASGYTLTLGQQIAGDMQAGLRLEDDFVPGEIIARFRPGSTAGKAAMATPAIAGLAQKAGAAGRPVLLTVPAPGTATVAGAVVNAPAGDALLQHKRETLRAIKQLRQRPDVVFAAPNYRRRATLAPDDTNYPLQWHYPLINLPQAWDITTGANAVIVAVVDTGILSGHPDLQGQIGQGYDFISDPASALDGGGIDADPEDPGDGGVAGTSSFHGTHVAGTVAAATGNATGVAGASWATTLMPLRVLGLNGGTSYDIMQALLYAAQLPNDSNTIPAQRADIINLSLGGYSSSPAEQTVINQVRGAGVMIVAAAGNDASSSAFYPASYAGVISVSAVDINRRATPYSNYGINIDIAAPGGNTATDINGDGYPDGVLSTSGDDSAFSPPQYLYRFLQGTSMATPHVAGTLALMKAVTPTLTPDDVDNLLLNGQLTTDLGTPGRDIIYGNGLIDAHKAVVAAQGGISPVPPTLVVSPSALNFGSLGTLAQLTVVNGGGGTLTVDPPTDDAAWLNVTPATIDPVTGTGTYFVSVSRSGLSEGTYSATVTFTSSANTVTLPIIMQVSILSQGADAGYHHVKLIDTTTGRKYVTGATISKGVYKYTISGVPSGTYEVIAGTDLNNDNDICVDGEACGGYIALDQLTPLTVSGNVTGVDFTSGFNVIINAASGATGILSPTNRQVGP